MGIEPFLVASVGELANPRPAPRPADLRGVQRTRTSRPSKQALLDAGCSEEEASKAVVYKGRGCRNCSDTGYKGRGGALTR